MSAEDRLPASYLELYAEPIEKSRQGWTFAEIAEVYGEEAAINAGIATDPDAAPMRELDGARPLAELHPELSIGPVDGADADTRQVPKERPMRFTPAKRLTEILKPAYDPCCGFKDTCKGTATWAPDRGLVPRGFIGALGTIEEVEVVILTAQPGAPPHPEEPALYSQARKQDLLERTCQYTFECFRDERDPYHKRTRFLLDLIFDPIRSLENQLRRAWITQTYLCSAPGGDSQNVRKIPAVECASRYLAPQLALFEDVPVIVLGGEAQKRVGWMKRKIPTLIKAPSPNARTSTAELQRRYQDAAKQARRMMRQREG